MEFSRRLCAHRGRANPFCTTALVIYKERTRRLVLEEGGAAALIQTQHCVQRKAWHGVRRKDRAHARAAPDNKTPTAGQPGIGAHSLSLNFPTRRFGVLCQAPSIGQKPVLTGSRDAPAFICPGARHSGLALRTRRDRLIDPECLRNPSPWRAIARPCP
jgi:hypothetical protein